MAGNKSGFSRREFIQTSAAAAAGWWAASSYARIPGANARLNIGFIGVGGIASSQHIPILQELGAGCPCYCDVDTNRMGACADRWSDATAYTDYRQMFDKQHGDFDAVMVGTPDHHHFPATIIAMMLGKHAYTQKPLTHTPWEARQLLIAQERFKLATQMGNQGHADESLRKTIDYLRSGAIGDLKEAHIWTNRPIWRQQMEVPSGSEPIPQNMNWDAWIGPAPMRPYRHEPADGWGGLYHPFNWRAFWDFGCGALGDMACHEVDPVYWAMNPGYPTAVELVEGQPFGSSGVFNQQSIVKFTFDAAVGRSGFVLYWYDGGMKPEKPTELEGETQTDRDGNEVPVELTAEGALYLGTRGKLIAMPNAREVPRLLPKVRHEEYGEPEQQIARSDGHHKEWYDACVGDKPFDHPKSNFGYAAPFTEFLLLGCIAQRLGGRLDYDARNMNVTNNPIATELLTKEYRDGWDFRMS